jgi:inner membrane protein
MDSLTQIVLGAAVGEIALGRKIGNRALIWGAIGGTIPDLDVLANPFMDDIDALAFHRSITHSVFFAVVASVVFGGIVYKLYDSKFHKSKIYKTLVTVINVAILAGITYGINYLFSHDGYPRWWFLLITVLGALFLLMRLYHHYIVRDLEEPQTTFLQWYWLFFLAFFTHLLLDCFTAFGTQVFQPFSDYRVAFNNIAVVDPLYTVPFLICIIIVSTLKRDTRKRAIVNWIGIGLSSFYMLLTIANKFYVDDVFDKALQHRNIAVDRCRTSPTIFNNLLWSCVAEDEHQYYVGQYSIFDSDPNLHWINVIPKNDSLHQAWSNNKDYKTLEWFSDGYLGAFQYDSLTVLSDLRYGGMTDTIKDHRDLVFNFKVKEVDGQLVFSENREPPAGDIGELLKKFWTRMKGY